MAAVARFYAGPNQFAVAGGPACAGARLKSHPRRVHTTDNRVTGSLRAALTATQVPFAHHRDRQPRTCVPDHGACASALAIAL
jgi:hypothetical protein